MKLLLLLVSAIAVLTLDSPDFPDGHKVFDSANKVQQLVEKAVFTLDIPDEQQKFESANRVQQLVEKAVFTLDSPNELQEFDSANKIQSLVESSIDDGTKDSESSEIMEMLMKERKGDHETQLRRSKCKARNACVVMGGFCVINTTHCEGRLVDEGCKGRDCQCCIPDDMENKIINVKLDFIIAFLNSSVESEGTTSVTSTPTIPTTATTEAPSTSALPTTTTTTTTTEVTTTAPGCPPGFFQINGTSSRCYKLFNDTNRSWSEADRQCRDEGLVLAKPDNNAVELRQYIVETYDLSRWDSYTWIGGKSDGSEMRWVQDNSTIPRSSTYWDYYDARSGHCLLYMTNQYSLTNAKTHPFICNPCEMTRWTLCEEV